MASASSCFSKTVSKFIPARSSADDATAALVSPSASMWDASSTSSARWSRSAHATARSARSGTGPMLSEGGARSCINLRSRGRGFLTQHCRSSLDPSRLEGSESSRRSVLRAMPRPIGTPSTAARYDFDSLGCRGEGHHRHCGTCGTDFEHEQGVGIRADGRCGDLIELRPAHQSAGTFWWPETTSGTSWSCRTAWSASPSFSGKFVQSPPGLSGRA